MTSSILPIAAQPAAAELLGRILDASGPLLALHHADGEDLLDQLRVMARHSGQAIYLWRAGHGLTSLRDMHAAMPNSLRLGAALRHIQQSQHFGVYLLQGVDLPLAASELLALRQAGVAVAPRLRRIVLLNPPTQVIDELGDSVMRLWVDEPDVPRPRLRDGRWLL